MGGTLHYPHTVSVQRLPNQLKNESKLTFYYLNGAEKEQDFNEVLN